MNNSVSKIYNKQFNNSSNQGLCFGHLNSIRDNISVNFNLREYVPSKYLRIPGDGNCLFVSLSYWLTGNIDSFNLVRLKVVENMVGKLKEPCNKFIVNKFPKSVTIVMWRTM